MDGAADDLWLKAKPVRADMCAPIRENGYQTGINWSVLHNGQHKYSSGANAGNFDLLTGAASGSLADVLGSGLPAASGASSGIFGLAF